MHCACLHFAVCNVKKGSRVYDMLSIWERWNQSTVNICIWNNLQIQVCKRSGTTQRFAPVVFQIPIVCITCWQFSSYRDHYLKFSNFYRRGNFSKLINFS